jgi:uncharacterized protein with PIN domain
MSLPIDNEVERGVMALLEAGSDTAALCAACLGTVLEVDRPRMMSAISRLMAKHLIASSLNRCSRCGETNLVLEQRPAPPSPH